MLNVMPYVIFNAHSVVRDSDGVLWDVTPNETGRIYPFILAEETEQEYNDLVEGGVSRIVHFR